MSDTSEKTNLLGLSPAKMEEFFLSIGEKKFRAQQMLKWIHQYGESDFEKMTNMGKALRAKLAEVSEIVLPEVVYEDFSKDGTRKWVMRMPGGSAVETVYIPEKIVAPCVSVRRLAAHWTAASAPRANRALTVI